MYYFRPGFRTDAGSHPALKDARGPRGPCQRARVLPHRHLANPAAANRRNTSHYVDPGKYKIFKTLVNL